MKAWGSPSVLISFLMAGVGLLLAITAVASDGWAYADALIVGADGSAKESHFNRGLFEFCVESICDYTGARVRGEKLAAGFLILSIFLIVAAVAVGLFGALRGFFELFRVGGVLMGIGGIFIIIGTASYASMASSVFAHTNNYSKFDHFQYGWGFVLSWCASVFCILSPFPWYWTSRSAAELNVMALTNV